MTDFSKVFVLMKFKKKTGVCNYVCTAMGKALLELYALQNTKSSEMTFVFERESGKIVFSALGSKSGFPEVRKLSDKTNDLGTCEDLGLSLEDLHDIKDDRFDKED